MKKLVDSRFSFQVVLYATIVISCLFGISFGASITHAEEFTFDTTSVQKLFSNAHANSTIILPKGTYELSGYIELPRENNVTIDATDAVFTGQITFLSAGNSGMKWKGGTFNGTGDTRLGFTLLHVENASFDGMTFNRATRFGQHVFDLLGSSDLTFKNLIVAGYGNSTDLSGLSAYQKYAEAIQTDYAIAGASGSTASEELLISYGGELDGAATGGITVKNSQFIPYYENGKMLSWAQSPMGQHLYAKDTQNYDINFTQNIVTNPIPLNEITQNKYTGALHFVSIKNLTITDNVFTSNHVAKRENWIQVVNNANTTNPGNGSGNLPTSGVHISRNNFIGVQPTQSYVSLVSDKNNVNFKITETIISNNTYWTNSLVDPTNWVSITDTDSQIEQPRVEQNHVQVVDFSVLLSQFEEYVKNDDISGPLVSILTNRLQQVEHHFNNGHDEQAKKHLQGFLKHIENRAHQQHISEKAKQQLTIFVEILLEK
ncbi:hypothetical protein J8TS2_27860 [Lederbergia ruris]|uniref:FIMAH domain-containing protein n=1 Tax=Lederbergia ruris TaxID=217495 RepID=A0ABQ4KKI6_9BACI|nr:hypothetical protein [Lederbergia ruris]GIN58467.1 hypothetical protein J8TS2_27860 [Lederbergia ruris]